MAAREAQQLTRRGGGDPWHCTVPFNDAGSQPQMASVADPGGHPMMICAAPGG
jgi:hypothetical protein